MQLFRQTLFPLFVFLLCSIEAVGSPLKNYLYDVDSKDSFWSVTTSENTSVNTKLLDKGVDYLNKSDHEVHSLTIIKGGQLVADYYGRDSQAGRVQLGPQDPHALYSTTKTITALLVGIAIEEKAIVSEHDLVLPYFLNDNVAHLDKLKKTLKLSDLLSMRSGLQFTQGLNDSLYSSQTRPTSALAILDQPLLHKPGTTFKYSSGDSQVLVEVLRRAIGKTPGEYAQSKLFGPLGIDNYRWYKDASGTEFGGWGLFLAPRDLARIGYLIMNSGVWKGKTIVPAKWLEQMAVPQASSPWAFERYGYHMWLPKSGGWVTAGYKGQNMYILPKLGSIVVFTAELPYDQADRIQLDFLNRFIIPAITN